MLKQAWVFNLKTKHFEDVKNSVLAATDIVEEAAKILIKKPASDYTVIDLKVVS